MFVVILLIYKILTPLAKGQIYFGLIANKIDI